jgi:hypothetical protein
MNQSVTRLWVRVSVRHNSIKTSIVCGFLAIQGYASVRCCLFLCPIVNHAHCITLIEYVPLMQQLYVYLRRLLVIDISKDISSDSLY